MEVNNSKSSKELHIVLKEYKNEKVVFNLFDLSFICIVNRSVHAYTNDNKSHNLFNRTISSTRVLIEKQNLQHHFYINTHIIVNYHFIKELTNQSFTDKEAIGILSNKGLKIGLTEYRNMLKAYKSIL
ncbi:MAG: hypothetical protein ACRCSR_00305 [Bacteroidales bacterium]